MSFRTPIRLSSWHGVGLTGIAGIGRMVADAVGLMEAVPILPIPVWGAGEMDRAAAVLPMLIPGAMVGPMGGASITGSELIG